MTQFPCDAVTYEGPGSKNPLSFKHYNAAEVVAGKTMADWFRFGCAYWHTMRGTGADPFGAARPPIHGMMAATPSPTLKTARVCSLISCRRSGSTIIASMTATLPLSSETSRSPTRLSMPLLMCLRRNKSALARNSFGARPAFSPTRATSKVPPPARNAQVYAYAAAQVKKAMEVTHRLGGEGYTFWGGREGYTTLLNTNMKRELDHLARFLHMAVDYKKEIGFKGQFYIEPKPQEPTTHQYDSDSAACLNFLREYDLLEHFKLNIETNHATLAGHTMEHELTVAYEAGALGSIDANMGTPNVGWDTDQFPTDLYLTTHTMLVLMKMGGFTTGGLNFDAKRRRESWEPVDLVHAHVVGMDAFARGLKTAAAIRADGRIDAFIKERYNTFDSGVGAEIEAGKTTLASLEKYALANGEPVIASGRQEMIEGLLNEFI